jgi:hypothetical protein
MAEIESSLGRTSVNTPHRRVFTVSDNESEETLGPMTSSEEFLAHQEEKRRPLVDLQSRQERVKAQNKITQSSKKKLEVLLGIGRATKDIEIDGINFSLQTLKDHEIEYITKLPKLFTENPESFKESTAIEFLFHLRRVTLVYSLFAIDGESVDSVFGTSVFDDKVSILGDLDTNLVTTLFNHYEKLKTETGEKYSLKNKTEVEEVVANIKK